MDLSNDELMESASSTLSERDWQILLTGAKELRFPAGHIIFDEGEKVSYIYKYLSLSILSLSSALCSLFSPPSLHLFLCLFCAVEL